MEVGEKSSEKSILLFYLYLQSIANQNNIFNSAYLSSRGGSYEPLEPPLAMGVLYSLDNKVHFFTL